MIFNKYKLQDCIQFKNGKKKPIEQGNIPIYGGNGVLGYTNVSNSEKESIIIGRVGAYCGCVFKEDNPCWISDNAIVGHVNENFDYDYFYYTLKNIDLHRLHIGSSHPLMTQDILNNIEVYAPNYNNQVKISKILESIDRKIELNKEINNNLYDLTNKLYEELFVKNRDESWHEYNLLELADFINGYSYTGKELVEESNIGMATIKNFERTGGFKEDGFKPLNPIKSKEQHEAKLFDILVACTDLTQNADIIGNAVMLLNTNNYDKVVISMDLVKVLPKNNHFMIYSILNSREFKNHALGYKSGTTVLHLNKDCFKDFNIKLPKQDIIDKFQSVAEANYKKISSNLKENKTLEQLRDTLLPKLMNGEIDLDNIEI